jgi:hypothetical protein
MKRDFIHDLYSSFTLWFDHELLTKGEAFSNTTSKLYKVTDDNFEAYNVYGSPFKQWVYDSSVPGVQIPSGVMVNGSFKARGVSGLVLDFQNGRAIFASGQNNWNVTGSYSVKDFNIYTTTKSDVELLVETKYLVNPAMPQVVTGLPSDKLVAPCVFLKVKGFRNEPFAFGGQDNTVVNIRAVILSDDEFKLNGVGNIFVDAAQRSFIVMTGTPLNRYNDIKNGYYNYTGSVNSSFAIENLAYLETVSFTKLNQPAVPNRFPDLFIGFLDFSINLPRYPRT